ncbi:hypothetical protein LK540_06465 [Massilia sp. IC2-278]|uniref:hypothetical protein n=1 Tax=Massilia sp. IC2-278 TaxID=2887200 RepID=UPI001E4D995C|nr:hypothetical protein [Massilia sp. IC2-278]MCC2960070.1 hypothetical protein [Massilia sp. IC2-278]
MTVLLFTFALSLFALEYSLALPAVAIHYLPSGQDAGAVAGAGCHANRNLDTYSLLSCAPGAGISCDAGRRCRNAAPTCGTGIGKAADVNFSAQNMMERPTQAGVPCQTRSL